MSKPLSILEIAAIRILVPPLAGLLFYGAWAYWVNMDFGSSAAWRAAATQGGYSFAITLILALVVEWLFQQLSSLPKHHWWVILIACLLLYITSWSVNAWSGTPNILLTILPGATVSTIYTVIYVMGLVKINKANKTHSVDQ